MNEESLNDVRKNTQRKMDSTLDALKREFGSIHAGRVSPALLENIKVDYYGNPTPVNQVGNISTPEPQMLVINPWEKNMIKEIERSLLKANLGLSVSNDGNVLRAVMPPLTEERRKDLVKQVKKIGEDAKIAVRNVRRDANDHLKKMEKDKVISKDEEKTALDEVQKVTDKHIEIIGEIIQVKEKELMTI
ncbi:MAG: ribosome recycling factor [SAR324 cluster bacterium]|nr:ribosome recycling factor [SAR324 cluster bacterium]MBF0350190.1 ribosome recycling factor [SAR324 cluster bacterium]